MANPMIEVLKHYGVPVNREEYINTAYMGKPPSRLDPESEGELPQDDSRFMSHRPTTHEEVANEEAEKAAKKTKGAGDAKPLPHFSITPLLPQHPGVEPRWDTQGPRQSYVQKIPIHIKKPIQGIAGGDTSNYLGTGLGKPPLLREQ